MSSISFGTVSSAGRCAASVMLEFASTTSSVFVGRIFHGEICQGEVEEKSYVVGGVSKLQLWISTQHISLK